MPNSGSNTETGKVTLTQVGTAAWITFDNPAKHNAMSLEMWRQLTLRLSDLPRDSRCVIVRGAGTRAFVSGADISEFAGRRRSPEDVAAYDDAAEEAMARLHECETPTIAMISGYCFGGGVALALCCDVRIAGDDATFSVPAARLGLGYGWRGLKKLLDVVSVPVATDIMISARRLTAAEALAVGLVNRLHATDALQGETTLYAEQIARNAPLTVRAVKRTIKELSRLDGPDFALCDRLAAECFASEDYLEGARAFLEKREPRFQGH